MEKFKLFKSKYFNSWGWATWQDRWLNKNLNPTILIKSANNYNLKNYLGSFRAEIYWKFRIWLIKNKKLDSWAYMVFIIFLKKKTYFT